MKAGAMVWRGGVVSRPGKVYCVMHWKEGLVVGGGRDVRCTRPHTARGMLIDSRLRVYLV